MSNALFYGICAFSFLIFNACLGVYLGKFLARNKRAYRPYTYEEMDAIEAEWYKEPHPD